MPDTYEILAVEDPASWDEFVRQAVGGSVFATRTWLDCASAAAGGEIHCYGCYKNGRIVAGISGLAQRRKGLKHLTTPVLTPHGGLLCTPIPSKGPAKLEAEWNRASGLLVEYLHKTFDYIQLSHTPSVKDVREFTWAGWEARVRYTYQMDLSDLEALWERVERRTRTVIRKAERNGFQVRSTDDVELFRHQYELIYAHQETRAPVEAALVQRFVERASQAGLTQIFLVESSTGAVASMVVFVRGFGTLYAWQAGADPAFNNTGALSLLYWKLFEQTPYKKFDFVGANIPAIAFFKRGFGGDLVPYFVVEGYKSALVKTAMAGKKALQQWLGA
jgi:hypothetical protein